MSRVRALGYGALVAVVVFYATAMPVLREFLGPAAVLPAYAAVALLAGAVTYRAVRYLSAPDDGDEEVAAGGTVGEPAAPVGREPDAAGNDGEEGEMGDLLDELEADREE